MITKCEKQSAPAVHYALDIIEAIGTMGEIGFNDLVASVGIPKASVSRIVRVLKDRGYIAKNKQNGKYIPGPKAAFAGNLQIIDSLRLTSTPVLESLSEAIGNQAVLLVLNSGNELLTVNRIQPEDAVAMMEVGKTNKDFARNPWGWILYDSMSDSEKRNIESQMADLAFFRSRIEKRLAFYRKNGFMFDNCEIREHIRRLAVPVFDKRSRLIATIGVGIMVPALSDDKILPIGNTMISYARELGSRL